MATQIALTLVLLTVALSFIVPSKPNTAGTRIPDRSPPAHESRPAFARYDQRQSDMFYRLLKERAAAIPRVTSVALTSFVPLNQDGGGRVAIVPEGFDLPSGVENLTVASARVDEAYFDTIGIPV